MKRIDRIFYKSLIAAFKATLSKGTPPHGFTKSYSVKKRTRVVRDSRDPATVRIYNHGPGRVLVSYGDARINRKNSVGTSILSKDEWDECPRPVVGKVKIASLSRKRKAVVTITEFS